MQFIFYKSSIVLNKIMNRESNFQKQVKKEIEERLPGCLIMKTDSTQQQGIPDLIILNGNRWAMLEVKKSQKAPHQPNQDYYIDKYNKWSYASFISPETKEAVLNEMEQSLKS